MSRCRRSAAACSATTASTGWPAGSSPASRRSIVAGSGRYSFKGAAYVRGGIFDRIELIQDTNSIRFRDRDHTRLGNLAAEGAPDFPEIALFVVPPEFAFDPTEPWVLQLLVQRVVGTREKAWLTFDLGYTLPDAYMKTEPAPPVRQQAATPPQRRRRQRRGRVARRQDILRRRRRTAVDEDLARRRRQDQHDGCGARRADCDLLLPERAGPPPQALHVGPPRLSAVHAGLARLVRQRPALGRQRPDLRQLAADRLQLGILPVRAADLHPLGRRSPPDCCSGGAGRSAAGSARSARCRNCSTTSPRR